MQRLVCFAFIALALFIQNHECAELEKQIKMTGTNTHYYNPAYVRELEYTVTKGNATYNNMKVHWALDQDLPNDLRVYSKIYATDINGENSHLILDDVTIVCEETEKRELLPKVLIVPESQLGGRCIKKGVYDMEDMGQLRFEQLVPDLLSEGQYYRVDYRLGSPTEAVLIVSFYSQWGYLEY